MKWPWINAIDGQPSQIESFVLQDIVDMSVKSADALKVVKLPFLATIEYGDQDLSEFLASLSRSNPEDFRRLLNRASLTAEDDTPAQIVYLETKNPAAAAEVANLDWVRDGITFREHATLNYLQEAALVSEGFFSALVNLDPPWIPVETGGAEATLYRLLQLSAFDDAHAISLLYMPFMNTIEFIDSEAVKVLYDLALSKPETSRRILSRTPLQDGISDEEAIYVLLFNLEENSPKAAKAIGSLPWVQDGIAYTLSTGEVFQGTETENVWTLVRLGEKSEGFLLELTTKSWVRDGINRIVRESSTLIDLDVIVSYDPVAALGVMELPLMDTYHREMSTAIQRLEAARWESREAFDQELERLGVPLGN